MIMDNPVSVQGLSVNFGNQRVLVNIYLELTKGTIYGLVGPNGAGKSTLIKAILGLEKPSTGYVKIFGGSIADHRKYLAYVPQRDEVDWTFPANVMDVVMMGRYPHKKLFQKMSDYDRQIAMDALKQLGIEQFANRQIGQLSGGQQQRVFIARALCQEAKILFLDEPFVGIDLTTEEKIVQILKKLADEGKTLVVVHHDLTTVKDYFDNVILLNQRLVAMGDAESTFTDENISKTYGAQLTVLHKTGLIG